MNIVQRVKDILLTPKQTWPVIDSEYWDVPTLYTAYIMLLALIPAIAGFIGTTLVGGNVFGYSVRVSLFQGLVTMVVGYISSLAMMFILAFITDALAPVFGGQKNLMSALKLVAFGSTAGMVGGIFSLIPAFSMLGVLASIYSIYLIFVGIPVLMKCPEEKALPYTAIVLVCGLIAFAILGGISAIFR